MRFLENLAAIGLLLVAMTAGAAVADNPDSVAPVSVGSKAPAFVAKEVDGRIFRFDPDSLPKPMLIIFYRGGWCPYCNAHLQDLHDVVPQIVTMGYEILFLSTDRPKLLYSSLKEKVPYHILSDFSMQAAESFGVAYRVDGATLLKLKSYGIDLDATQGSAFHELPVPSVFVVDKQGVVRFRHYDPNYEVRLDAAHVLAAARDSLN